MKVIKFHYGQSQILKASQRYVLAVAGTGGGKSYCGPLWMAREILKKPGQIYFVASPTYDVCRKATVRNLCEQWADTDFDGTWSEASHEWKFRNKKLGSLYIVSCDNWQSIQGWHATCGWLDEAGQYSEEAFHSLQARLNKNNGRMLITTTPYSDEGWFADMVKLAKATPDQYYIMQWPSYWNPTYSREAFEQAKQSGSMRWYRMMYLGEFGSPEFACCPDFTEGNIRTCIYDKESALFIGSDFNADRCTWAVLQETPSGNINCIDEIYVDKNAKTSLMLDELYDRFSSHTKGFIFYGDASSQSRHTSASETDYQQILMDHRFAKLGRNVNYPSKNPGQVDRINSFNAYVLNAAQQRRIFIDPHCKHIIEDIKLAEYVKGTRQIDKKKFDPHGLDAISYMVHYRHPLQVQMTVKYGLGFASYAK